MENDAFPSIGYIEIEPAVYATNNRTVRHKNDINVTPYVGVHYRVAQR